MTAAAVETRWGDASHWSGNVNWSAWFAGNKGDVGIAKCTEGATGTDPQYAANRAKVRAARKLFGAYCYVDATASSGAAQAARLLKVAGLKPGELAICDAENSHGWSQGAFNAWLAQFGDTLLAAGGVTAIVYGSRDYIASGTFRGLVKHFHYLWTPRYPGLTRWPTTVDPGLAGNLSGWPDVDAWQWSPGVGGIDASVSSLTLAQLSNPTSPTEELFTMGQYENIMAAIGAVPERSAELTLGQPILSKRPESAGKVIAVRDYIASIDVDTDATTQAALADTIVAKLLAALPPGDGGTVDVKALAAEVVAQLAAKLATP